MGVWGNYLLTQARKFGMYGITLDFISSVLTFSITAHQKKHL